MSRVTSFSLAAGGFTPVAPTVQRFLVTGVTTGALFAVASTGASAALGAVYGNNGSSYLVLAAYNGITFMFTGGTNFPAALSGSTLQLLSGSGSSGIGFVSAQTMSSYNMPSTLPLYLKVTVAGGGGGGGAGGTGGGNGASGMPSAFGTANVLCLGGAGGVNNGNGGVGGTGVIISGSNGVAFAGTQGTASSAIVKAAGGAGGENALGGGGGGGDGNSGAAGSVGVANTGGGGSGGGAGTAAVSGSGGGAGGYVTTIIASPVAGTIFPYVVGAAGAGVAGGTGGGAGSAGGVGVVLVEEFYQ